MAATREYMREWQARNREIGRCTKCVRPAAPEKTLCEKHLEYARDASARRRALLGEVETTKQRETREKRRAEGRCYFCREVAKPGRSLCAYHGEVQAAERRDRRERLRTNGVAYDTPEELAEIKLAAETIPHCRCGLRLLSHQQAAQGHCDACVPPAAFLAQQRRTHWSDGVSE